LYILDSLDALSDEAELEKFQAALDGKDVAGSYGTGKAKKMSEMFRLLTQDAEATGCSLGIISQIRDKIGVSFGETKTRSGGHALDFYCSQVLWLTEIGKLERSAYNQKRVVGVSVRSKNKKCKVGSPFRECDYDILFGYGIDDENSMIDY